MERRTGKCIAPHDLLDRTDIERLAGRDSTVDDRPTSEGPRMPNRKPIVIVTRKKPEDAEPFHVLALLRGGVPPRQRSLSPAAQALRLI